MLTLAHVMNLFANEFTRLSRWRFSLRFVAPRAIERFLLRHSALRASVRMWTTAFALPHTPLHDEARATKCAARDNPVDILLRAMMHSNSITPSPTNTLQRAREVTTASARRFRFLFRVACVNAC